MKAIWGPLTIEALVVDELAEIARVQRVVFTPDGADQHRICIAVCGMLADLLYSAILNVDREGFSIVDAMEMQKLRDKLVMRLNQVGAHALRQSLAGRIAALAYEVLLRRCRCLQPEDFRQ